MNKPEIWLRGAVAAWEMVIDFPLPEPVRRRGAGPVPGGVVLAWLPLIGLLAGAVIALAAYLVGAVLNPVAGSVLFALLGVLFWDCKDSGRGVALIASLFWRKLQGEPMVEALPELDSNVMHVTSIPAAVFLTVLEILKLALLFLLSFYGAKFWLGALLAGSFSLQGLLATRAGRQGAAPLLILSGAEDQRAFLLTSLVVWVICFLFFPLATLAAVLILNLTSGALARGLERNYGGVTADLITLSGALAELLLLLVGIGGAITFS